MKDKQGEHLDHRVRQALSTLPDEPVRGTSFDAAALWDQLRPELAAQPAASQRSAPRRWWWLAASLVGTLLGGWWWIAQPKSTGAVATVPTPVAVTHPLPRTQRPETASPAEMQNQSARPQPEALAAGDQAVTAERKVSQRTPLRPVRQLLPQPVQAETSDVPAVVAAPDPPQRVAATTYPVATSTVQTSPKRRFAVVHQNDLRAEAEGRAKLERNDRFVRMGGLSAGTSLAPATDKPGLLIPLN